MSVAHLLFAALMTAYIFVAIPLEERDLLAHFGATYARYREDVGALTPRFGGRVRPVRSLIAPSAVQDWT
jgi:protein-S-isoprenylcysteine O-methyltransferase Ste14